MYGVVSDGGRSVEKNMHGIRPENLTNKELVHYAWLTGAAQLPPDWVVELIKRLEDSLKEIVV